MDDATHTVLTTLTAAMNARQLATTSFELTGRLAAKGIDWSAMSRALHWLATHGYVRRTGDGEYTITEQGLAAASTQS
jgi:hypothetical protein